MMHQVSNKCAASRSPTMPAAAMSLRCCSPAPAVQRRVQTTSCNAAAQLSKPCAASWSNQGEVMAAALLTAPSGTAAPPPCGTPRPLPPAAASRHGRRAGRSPLLVRASWGAPVEWAPAKVCAPRPPLPSGVVGSAAPGPVPMAPSKLLSPARPPPPRPLPHCRPCAKRPLRLPPLVMCTCRW